MTLDLSRNNIDKKGSKLISLSLSSLKNLTFLELVLIQNIIGEEGADLLSQTLKQLKNLTTLGLYL